MASYFVVDKENCTYSSYIELELRRSSPLLVVVFEHHWHIPTHSYTHWQLPTRVHKLFRCSFVNHCLFKFVWFAVVIVNQWWLLWTLVVSNLHIVYFRHIMRSTHGKITYANRTEKCRMYRMYDRNLFMGEFTVVSYCLSSCAAELCFSAWQPEGRPRSQCHVHVSCVRSAETTAAVETRHETGVWRSIHCTRIWWPRDTGIGLLCLFYSHTSK